jgi:hypothetical protein
VSDSTAQKPVATPDFDPNRAETNKATEADDDPEEQWSAATRKGKKTKKKTPVAKEPSTGKKRPKGKESKGAIENPCQKMHKERHRPTKGSTSQLKHCCPLRSKEKTSQKPKAGTERTEKGWKAGKAEQKDEEVEAPSHW